uniref:Receptor protein-tyrosine kinase n=1 Tax=Romanomermis culicivorax TaxID=13658 RepID=A0A915KMT6_ROMCU
CTGPGNFVGSNGCKKCKYGIVEEDDLNISVTKCLTSISQEKCQNVTGLENYYWNAPTAVGNLVEHGICSKCHPFCRLCTQYGRDVLNHGCVCQHVMVHRRFTNLKECDIACPQNYYNVTSLASNLTECHPCHTECDEGCTGENPTQCFKCKSFENINGNQTECVPICPKNKPYLNGKICSDIEMENLVHTSARKRTQKIIIIICGAVTFLLVLLIVVSWVSCRRAQMLAKMGMLDDQYEMNLAARPDMSKLTIISENDLKIGDVMGFGAFGTVHKVIF